MKKQLIIPIIITAILGILLVFSGIVIYQKKRSQKLITVAQNNDIEKPLTKKQLRKKRKEEKQHKKEQEQLKKNKHEATKKKKEVAQRKTIKNVAAENNQPAAATSKNISHQEQPIEKNKPHQNLPEKNNTHTIEFDKAEQHTPHFDDTHDNKLLFSIDTNTFLAGGSNLALLNSSHNFDSYLYMQSLIDLSLHMETPAEQTGKPVEFKFTGRINTILGNSGEMAPTSEEFVKIGRAVTETKHTHTIDRPLIWAKEAWLKIFSESKKTFFQTGFFSKKIGLGFALGDGYKTGNPVLMNNSEQFIDQYRPGVQLQTTSESESVTVTGYYGMNITTSSSLENQAAYTNGQELTSNQAPYKRANHATGKFSNNYLASLELDFHLGKKTNEQHINLKPFLLFNKDNRQQVEFTGDATSKLWTLGFTLDAQKNNFSCNLECGINFGQQDVKAWDRNVVEEHARLTQTHLFARTYGLIDNPSSAISDAIDASGDWELSPAFPWPSEEDRGLQFGAGVEYRDENPTLVNNDFLMPPNSGGSAVDMNHIFKNSYSRFRKAYSNSYKGWMIALDASYKFSEKLSIGFIGGVASGDDNPNDRSEKAYLYRLDSNWDNIRQDTQNHNYSGFVGIQSLYSSKNVPSLFFMHAHKLNKPINQGPSITNPRFSNLGYFGIGVHYNNNNPDKNFHFNPNLLVFATPHSVKFGYDPTVHDIFTTYLLQTGSANYDRFINSYDKTLSNMLGIELNACFNFIAKDTLRFYATAGLFLPGSYYSDIKSVSYKNQGQNIPLKNQLELSRLDVTGLDSTEFYTVTLLDNAAWYFNLGVEFNFDTQTTLFHKRRKKQDL